MKFKPGDIAVVQVLEKTNPLHGLNNTVIKVNYYTGMYYSCSLLKYKKDGINTFLMLETELVEIPTPKIADIITI